MNIAQNKNERKDRIGQVFWKKSLKKINFIQNHKSKYNKVNKFPFIPQGTVDNILGPDQRL